MSAGGIITTVAGNGIAGYSGDGGPAISAALQITSFGQSPSGLVVDTSGNLYIADTWNNRVRKVSLDGTITTVAGTGGAGYSGDGGPAINAQIGNPGGLALDSAGNLYISHNTPFDCVVRKVTVDGIITTVAGQANCGYSGDGGPATSALLNRAEGIVLDSLGNLYIADTGNQRVRKVSPGGVITTVAGTGNYTFDGDGGPATSFALNYPYAVTVDAVGNLYIADANNYRIRKVSASGTITTVAGNGNYAFSGDGGSATSAEITQPDGITIDSAGNLYISDLDNNRVRRLTASAAAKPPRDLPILFAAGFCDTAVSWNTLENQVIGFLSTTSDQDAPIYSDQSTHTLYYDGNAVRQYPGGDDLTSAPIEQKARFFAIDFYAANAFGTGNNGPIDVSAVAQVSILNKADELAHVIQALTTITGASQVIIVAHSLGGLVARAYMQGLAATLYGQNVAKLITLDTPHSGASIAEDPVLLERLNQIFPACNLASSVNLAELDPSSSFIDLLYHSAERLPANATIAAIESFTNLGPFPVDSAPSDGIVTQAEQSFLNSIAGSAPPFSNYDVINLFPAVPSSCPTLPLPILHPLTCLGEQTQTWVLVEAEIQKALTGGASAGAPVITAVVNAFSAGQTISPNTWVTITGTKLAPDERTWQGSDFLDQRMPTSLDGVSVMINGENAYLYYISSNQLNILTPPDLGGGDVQVQVSNNGGVSPPFTVQAQQYSPSFFTFDGIHVTATHADGSLIGPPTLYPGLSTPAKPNETIVLYANGFGPTSTAVVNSAETQSGNLPSLPTVTIGEIAASVQFAGLVSPGTYQFNVVVPALAPTGDDTLLAAYSGLKTQAGVTLSVNAGAVSVNFTEYPIPTPSSYPFGIVAGPDGALWFTEPEANKIGRCTTAGVITEYPVPTSSFDPLWIAVGPDGALWFTEVNHNKIGRMTISGAVTEYPLSTPSSNPTEIAVGSDGALWFTEVIGRIGRITTAGVITEYAMSGSPWGIAAGPDGALWFTESLGNKIARITTDGLISEYAVPTASSYPDAIIAGPDGALWFTELFGGKIGRITTTGLISEYSVPSLGEGIAVGPDGALWFPGVDKIGRISTTGTVSEYSVPTPNSVTGEGITAGPDGALWFTERDGNKIGRVMP